MHCANVLKGSFSEWTEKENGHTRCAFFLRGFKFIQAVGGSVAEWLACWIQAQTGLGSNCSRDAVW